MVIVVLDFGQLRNNYMRNQKMSRNSLKMILKNPVKSLSSDDFHGGLTSRIKSVQQH